MHEHDTEATEDIHFTVAALRAEIVDLKTKLGLVHEVVNNCIDCNVNVVVLSEKRGIKWG